MAGNEPEERVAVPVISQSWRQAAFLHWRVDTGVVGASLPDGLAPDIVDGSAWVSLTPFRVERARLLNAPPLPIGSSFPETNLRTYVVDRNGRDGIWFLSLDVTSALNVAGGRIVGAPYFLAAMSVRGASRVRYRSRRLLRSSAGHDITLDVGDPIQDGDDDHALAGALAGRWRAFTRSPIGLWEVPVEHEPWPLRRAEVVGLDETLVAAAGLPPPSEPPAVHFADGVEARLGRPRRAG